MIRTFVYCFAFTVCTICPAWSSPFDIVDFSSEISAQIYQPDPAKVHEQKAFPTLYIMDGQHFIYSAIGYQQSLNWRNPTSPKFIVVAIDTSKIGDGSAKRRNLLNADSKTLINVIEEEIIPYVESHYPASDMRLFAGWENTGGFAIDLLTTSPNLFESFLFASSPNISAERLKNVENLIVQSVKNKTALNKQLYIALGTQENYAVDAFNQLNLLGENHPSQLDVQYLLSSELNHFTTPMNLFTQGLAWVFRDYPAVNFYSVDDIFSFGGIPAVQAYFAQRGERYYVSKSVAENTVFTMARHAAQADNLGLFLEIEQTLGKLNQETFQPYWTHFFVSFLIKNKQWQRAEEILYSVMARYPQVPQLIELDIQLKQQKAKLSKTSGKE